jgi:soluble lytic murein transglycosylase-like protein
VSITAPKVAEAATLATTSEDIPLSSKEDYIAYIDKEAPKYGVSPAKVENVIGCESKWNPKAVSETNDYGLAQLHLPKKGVSREMAFDPKYSLDYIIKNWKKDHWTCQRILGYS